jgi:membrane protein
MEGQRRDRKPENQQPSDEKSQDRGRSAKTPTEITKPGWRDIALRTKDGIAADNVPIIAGGVAFFLLLGLIPGIAALISIYGLVADPADIQAQFAAMSGFLPEDARRLLEEQMTRIAGQPSTAGFAAAISIAIALWGGATAMKTLMNALNIIYNEQEKRGFIKLTLAALGLTLALILIGGVSIGLIVVLPPLVRTIGLGDAAGTVVTLLRWPLLLVVALVALAVVYRFAPSRDEPQWKWVSAGAVVATLLWVAGSALFAVYVGNFGNYNETYGSLGAVIVLMMWLYISAFVVLLGAEVNAEMEHQTGHDTTKGKPQPIGQRGAHVADNVGEQP